MTLHKLSHLRASVTKHYNSVLQVYTMVLWAPIALFVSFCPSPEYCNPVSFPKSDRIQLVLCKNTPQQFYDTFISLHTVDITKYHRLRARLL